VELDHSAPGAAGPATVPATGGDVAGVTRVDLEVLDGVRPTRPASGGDGEPGRRLPTTVYLPDATTPRPLVVFSHGLGGHPDRFTRLLGAWAAAGYVVAAPVFPLTSAGNPNHALEVADLANQPGDVTAVIDAVVGGGADPDSPLCGRVDQLRIGAAGLSLGGATTYGLLASACCRDPRVGAAIVMAGAMLLDPGGVPPLRVPLLALHGDADASIPVAAGRAAWEALAGPGYFISLAGAAHSPAFEDPVTDHDRLVAATTVAFWDLTLGGDATGSNRITAALADAGALAMGAVR